MLSMISSDQLLFLVDHQPATDFIATHDQDFESFKFCTITESTVYNLLKSLDIRKSTGPDGTSAHFLKEVAEAAH